MSPSATFKKTNGKSLGAAYQYYVALLVIFTVLYGIVVVSMGLAAFTSMVDKMGAVPIVGGVAAGAAANFSGFVIALGVFFVYLVFLFYLLGVFVEGLIMHAFVLLMGGEKGARQTIKTTMYASTPFLLFGWIPFVSIIAYIWSFVLLIIGLKENHEMELGNAIIVVFIPVVLGIVLIGLGSAVIVAFMSATAALIPTF
ncbi:MAG: YIP1 family protein [Methanoregula sp.]|nr:YIP1 family protein [Methanoregula sp.]